MPELPEVEVTRQGVAPHVEKRKVTGVVTRHTGLRWPFPEQLDKTLHGQVVRSTGRRGKYLMLHFDHGDLIIHLGMSGHLRVLPKGTPVKKHDHIDIEFGRDVLRMNDPRRFGAVLWHPASAGPIEFHPMLSGLGVEPLSDGFNAKMLYEATRTRSAPIKQVLLAGDIVVGVGNIYACESLFAAGIAPSTPAHRIGLTRYARLTEAIRDILSKAIVQGGSTLRDFVAVNGQSGYFQQTYFVYARAGEPCRVCGQLIRQIRQGQRSTFYCPHCQK